MHALILVDIQNDFCGGGALAVPGGDAIVPMINELMVRQDFDLVLATQDWHPRDHGSFAANHAGRHPGELIDLDGLEQVLWPVHCVQGTFGAEFHPALDQKRIAEVFRKGQDPTVDSYSGFFDNGRRKATGLDQWLRMREFGALTIVGLATDYCVKFTALDAVALGYHTQLIQNAVRGVDLQPGDSERALRELAAAGVVLR